MHELRTIYSFNDGMLMVEALEVKNYNEYVVQEAQKEETEKQQNGSRIR